MPSRLFSLAVAGVLTVLAAVSASSACRADESSRTTAPPVPSAPTPSSPQTPAASAQSPSGQAPATGQSTSSQSPPATSQTAPETKQGAASTGETVDLSARPFAFIEGKAGRDEIYGAILGSLGLVKQDMDKTGVKPAGRPLAVFVESDDSGFRYHAGYPIEGVPEGRTSLSDAVKIAQTPSGKAMRFEHLGSYADIDATYDAITAYLDEKGIDAQDSFVEEYANDVKDADDPNLQVNIFVLLK
jgi:effector-binding domain-containing protein